MTNGLPVEPGSLLDGAINLLTQLAVEGSVGSAQLGLTKLVDVQNSAHMLALGTRIKVGMEGVGDPRQLVSTLYEQWYGKPTPAAAPSATEDIAW